MCPHHLTYLRLLCMPSVALESLREATASDEQGWDLITQSQLSDKGHCVRLPATVHSSVPNTSHDARARTWPENMPGTKRRAEGEESDLLSIRPL